MDAPIKLDGGERIALLECKCMSLDILYEQYSGKVGTTKQNDISEDADMYCRNSYVAIIKIKILQ